MFEYFVVQFGLMLFSILTLIILMHISGDRDKSKYNIGFLFIYSIIFLFIYYMIEYIL